MFNWLRRLMKRLDRRWIHDPTERFNHDVRVKKRLADWPSDEGPEPEPETAPEPADRK